MTRFQNYLMLAAFSLSLSLTASVKGQEQDESFRLRTRMLNFDEFVARQRPAVTPRRSGTAPQTASFRLR